MRWYYTEGELTLKVDRKEHRFSLQELIASSSVYQERRKKVRTVFLATLLLTGALQLYGGGVPTNEDLYFYIGYFATPLIISGIISFLAYLPLRYSKKEIRTMDSILREHLS